MQPTERCYPLVRTCHSVRREQYPVISPGPSEFLYRPRIGFLPGYRPCV